MNIPALPLQTGEDEEGQTFEIIFSAKGWASPPTLHNRAAQGLDVRHLPSPSPCGRGEVFSLDIPFYRTRHIPDRLSMLWDHSRQCVSEAWISQTLSCDPRKMAGS